ncbi:hypothetical protein [Streptomyces hesseae]|uniref:Uncharacterized protein n=1 Tax=Streptomyces hesseae TaxID=3075519 RepID=A0ABU2SU95_9ACTN|nr:hypothetical protein [Streptomyces sp. DSM 40473]MDT0452496.1 hypothetical protein [Streptomyces sp. DSM 40473]
MSGQDRREAEVRRLLDGPRPAVPAEVVARAAERGRRLVRRRRVARGVGWALLVLALVVFSVWAAVEEPWRPRPSGTAPPLWDGE